jgi:RNA-directed DNA polymerase
MGMCSVEDMHLETTVRHLVCEGLAHWRRWRIRKSLWELGRQPRTRSRTLVAMGREVARARKATITGRGAWWKAGASPLPAAVKHRVLAAWGLVSLLEQRRDRER